MKIVHYSTRLGRSAGGLYHSVSGLARAMRNLGAEIVVAGGVEKDFSADRHVWSDLPLVTHELDRCRYGLSPALLTWLWSHRPHILHIHGVWSAASFYGRFAPPSTQIIVSPRGMLDPWITARRRWLKSPHAALFERPMLRRAHLHALSSHERKMIGEFAPLLHERIFVLHNGIEQPAATATTERSGTLFLGRLHEKKQVVPLMRAWANRTGKARLTIAGWGSPDYEREVTALARADKRIHFAGAVYGEAKSALYQSHTFFILPSLSEGLPMAALEALSHGCIPILTDACHLPELFDADVALRMEADFSDFAAVMARACAMNSDELKSRSDLCRIAARKYHWPDIARSMLNRYAAILGRPSQ